MIQTEHKTIQVEPFQMIQTEHKMIQTEPFKTIQTEHKTIQTEPFDVCVEAVSFWNAVPPMVQMRCRSPRKCGVTPNGRTPCFRLLRFSDIREKVSVYDFLLVRFPLFY